MVEGSVGFPFETNVLRSPVTAEGIDLVGEREIVAVCCNGTEHQQIRPADLPLPSPPPDGAEWIAAYRRWISTFWVRLSAVV